MERMNIAQQLIERGTLANPRGLAIVSGSASVTYAELPALINRTAAALRTAGCERGARVLLALPDSIELATTFLAAIRIGALPVLISPHVTSAEYSSYASDADPAIAILHASTASRVASKPHTFIVSDGEDHEREWASIVAAEREITDSVLTDPTDPAFMLYSSGSGGRPKGVLHKHASIIAACRNFGEGVIGISKNDRTFSVSRLFFAYGLGNALYYPLSVGATTILEPNRPTIGVVARIMTAHRPTLFFAVPTFYRMLRRESESGQRLDWSSVRCAVSAGETLPADLFE